MHKRESNQIKRSIVVAIGACLGLLLTIGFSQPAISDAQAKVMEVNVNNLVTPTPKPDFDRDVLTPLRAAQQAKAEADAKAERERLAAERQRQAELERTREVQRAQEPVAVQVSGDCSTWLAGAGITDIANAMYVISRESGCNPYAVNASSGACGIGQALPCAKAGCAMGDGQCQMIWMNNYVLGRYGSWANAVGFWQSHHWY